MLMRRTHKNGAGSGCGRIDSLAREPSIARNGKREKQQTSACVTIANYIPDRTGGNKGYIETGEN
jgi:hypothetical protein